MTERTVSAIYRPSRRDQRTSRQILADLGTSEACPAIAHIAAGPLAQVIRFLAGCRLTFVLLARDERHRHCSVGSPDAESVTRLVQTLLGKQPPELLDTDSPTLVGTDDILGALRVAARSPCTESAVEEIVDGLRQRELAFVFGWQLPGECRVRLDYTIGASRDKIREWVESFLTERLGVSICRDRLHHPSEETLAHA